jgi:hypothetical protein
MLTFSQLTKKSTTFGPLLSKEKTAHYWTLSYVRRIEPAFPLPVQVPFEYYIPTYALVYRVSFPHRYAVKNTTPTAGVSAASLACIAKVCHHSTQRATVLGLWQRKEHIKNFYVQNLGYNMPLHHTARFKITSIYVTL